MRYLLNTSILDGPVMAKVYACRLQIFGRPRRGRVNPVVRFNACSEQRHPNDGSILPPMPAASAVARNADSRYTHARFTGRMRRLPGNRETSCQAYRIY